MKITLLKGVAVASLAVVAFLFGTQYSKETSERVVNQRYIILEKYVAADNVVKSQGFSDKLKEIGSPASLSDYWGRLTTGSHWESLFSDSSDTNELYFNKPDCGRWLKSRYEMPNPEKNQKPRKEPFQYLIASANECIIPSP